MPPAAAAAGEKKAGASSCSSPGCSGQCTNVLLDQARVRECSRTNFDVPKKPKQNTDPRRLLLSVSSARGSRTALSPEELDDYRPGERAQQLPAAGNLV